MHFALHPEQQELIDAVATVLAAKCTPSDLGAIAEGSTSRAKERWNVLSELGVMALLAPESAGGLALSEVEMVGVLEVAGKAVLPEPFAESAVLGVSLLRALPGQSDLLQEVATGTARVSVGGPEVGAGGALLTTSAKVRLDFARSAAFRAAYSLARNRDSRHHDSVLAKAPASDAGDIAARVGLQVHGAIGYTWERDLQFCLKRIWVLPAAWGDAVSQRVRVLNDALAKVNE